MSTNAPSTPVTTPTTEAFSRAAEQYDSFVGDHPHLQRMRDIAVSTVRRHAPTSECRILEINAGTGIDALTLSSLGYRVHATDIAPEMLRRAEDRSRRPEADGRLTVQACSFLDLGPVVASGDAFDVVFSNFGGLNCTPDLSAVARQVDRVLRPGGIAVLVVMPPVCPWELIYLAAGRWRFATRRLRRSGTTAHLGGIEFPVHYHRPSQVAAAFGGDYSIAEVRGLSVVAPRDDSREFPLRRPRAYQALTWLDDRLAHRWPFSRCGDYVITTLRRHDAATTRSSGSR